MATEDLFVTSVVPCLAKKSEAKRDEFICDDIADVDEVLTTTELIEMAEAMGLNSDNVPRMKLDEPYQRVSGAGVLFGITGGVAEATLRMACATEQTPTQPVIEYEVVRGMEGIKLATVKVGDLDVRIAVVNGLKNVQPIIKELEETGKCAFNLIEVMSCPGGCVSGAGHPVPKSYTEISERHKILIDIDKSCEVRTSQDNPDLKKLYNEFIGEANSDIAHRLFHTHYSNKMREDSFVDKDFGESVWKTKTIEVCICEQCNIDGSSRMIAEINEAIKNWNWSISTKFVL